MNIKSVFKIYPVKNIVLSIITVTIFVSVFISFYVEDFWLTLLGETFTYTLSCNVFCLLLLFYFYEKIKGFTRYVFFLLLLLLVFAGVVLGVFTANLILNQNFTPALRILGISLLVGCVGALLSTMFELYRRSIVDKTNRLREAELENEKLKRYELIAKLNSLQAKLNPHFLFNTLNTTAALIFDSPEKAEKNIINLSNLYRKVLQISNKTMIPVKEEIELIEDYYKLEKQRFEDDLSLNINCPESLEGIKIPGLIIEPLIENSIKHNLDKTGIPIKIEITLSRSDGFLNITVRDDGKGFDVDTVNWGFGLYSIQERLRIIYNDNYEINIDSEDSNGTLIKLKIPLDS
ncbi:sensor histidine kinase [candidate division KSB1 bacterium]